MPATIPALSTPLPTTSGMTEAEFNTAMNKFIDELTPYGEGANALAAEAEANAARAEAAAAEVANTVWVSGTPYTAGQVRYSPVDFLSYRRKTDGAGTTDPSQDPTNWELQTSTSVGGADTTSSATDITLTFTSGRLQIIAMSAAGKKVTAPAATTLKKGTPLFVVKNAGNYRFSFHKNGGGFVCYVDPGQVLAFHCSDTSTGAGVWHVSGQDIDQIYGGNTAEVLNAVNSTYLAATMLSPTKAICAFKNNSITYLNAVILNYGSSSGAPVAVNAEGAFNISIAAQTSIQATIAYQTSTGVTKACVLDVSGNTITPGAVSTIDSGTGGSGTAIGALSSTQLLCLYQNSPSGTPRERVLDISASAITASSEVAADATTAAGGGYFRVKKISASKALIAFKDSASNRVQLRLQSITGSVPAPTGTVTAISPPGTSYGSMFGLVIKNTTRAIVVHAIDRTYADLIISLINISGTSPVIVTHKLLRVGLFTTADISAAILDADTIYATWTGGASLGVDAVTIKITDDDQIIVSAVASRLQAGVGASSGYMDCDSLDSTHVMLVCRNESTYLSAKTIEVAS